ncbi:MAG: RecX family transcriptional regulator [Bacteroidales bacterium]|nr:RecX family transcriptional regulator [Bacteroidales bacterium]MBR1799832.1 RecX family transcriptional regulator [Bacteroidales bacterium]
MADNPFTSNLQQAALLQRAVAWCVSAERTSHDAVEHLCQWGAESADAVLIVRWLEEEGYIDDARYAKHYSESKVLWHGWGRKKVTFNLRSKGISSAIIADALEAIDETTYLETATKVAKAKWHTLMALPYEQRMVRIKAFLAQRGFTMQEIYQTITNLNSK